MARQASSGIMGRAGSTVGLTQDAPWAHVAYRVGLSLLALGFVGVAVSISVGLQHLVVACVTATAAGGVAAAFGLYRMYREDQAMPWDIRQSDDGEDGDGGGGGGWRQPEPTQTPPRDGATPPEVSEDPAWWHDFERQLAGWVVEEAKSSSNG